MSPDLAISLGVTVGGLIFTGGAAYWRLSRVERDIVAAEARAAKLEERATESEKQVERARETLHALRSEMQAIELRAAAGIGKLEELIREMRAELREEIRALGRK